MSQQRFGHPVLETRTDEGAVIELFDIVGGAPRDLVETLCSIHVGAFPEHLFAVDLIREDARLPNVRDGIIVHQWLLTVDGEPVGYSLADSNLVRRIAPLHFFSVLPSSRGHTVGGVRLGTWLMTDLRRQYLADAGDPGLGAAAETPEYKMRIFEPNGWQRCQVTYLEPIHGWNWRTEGLEVREIALLWLPPTDLGDEAVSALAPAAVAPAAASFLIDMYHLDASVPWLETLCGAQIGLPGPSRSTVVGTSGP